MLETLEFEKICASGLASLVRYWGEFLNNGRAEFCEMWNASLERASFGILRAAVRFAYVIYLSFWTVVLFFMDMTYQCLKEELLRVR